MKRFLKSLGMAGAYFAVFLGIQTWISAVAIVFFLANLVWNHGFALLMNDDILVDFFLNGIFDKLTVITLVSNVVTIIAFWIFFAARGKRFTWEIGLQKTKLSNVALSVLFGFGLCFAVELLMAFLPVSEDTMAAFEEQHDLLFEGSALLTFLSVSVVGPISEEICFRGLCYTRLRLGIRAFWSAVISAILFGMAHGDPVWMVAGFAAGMGLAWVFETTGSLWCAIAVHVTNNVLAFVSAYFTVSAAVEWCLIFLGVAALIVSAVLLHTKNRRPQPELAEIQ